jgi:hypothetical protein
MDYDWDFINYRSGIMSVQFFNVGILITRVVLALLLNEKRSVLRVLCELVREKNSLVFWTDKSIIKVLNSVQGLFWMVAWSDIHVISVWS